MHRRPLLLAATLLFATSAFAQAPARCDRTCLQRWVDNYLAAMRDQNKDRKSVV